MNGHRSSRRSLYHQMLTHISRNYGIRIIYHKRGAQFGRAGLEEKLAYIPEPLSFTSFFTGLHEIGHILSGHRRRDGKPVYRWEYEAFLWAYDYATRNGLAVPEKILNYEKSLLAEKVREAVENGARKVDSALARFIKSCTARDPDVEFVRRRVRDDGSIR